MNNDREEQTYFWPRFIPLTETCTIRTGSRPVTTGSRAGLNAHGISIFQKCTYSNTNIGDLVHTVIDNGVWLPARVVAKSRLIVKVKIDDTFERPTPDDYLFVGYQNINKIKSPWNSSQCSVVEEGQRSFTADDTDCNGDIISNEEAAFYTDSEEDELNNEYEKNDSSNNSKIVEKLNEKIEQLKIILRCKVCLIERARILFIPCRHLPCCSTCCSSLSICPICRRSISQKITVYLC